MSHISTLSALLVSGMRTPALGIANAIKNTQRALAEAGAARRAIRTQIHPAMNEPINEPTK